MSFVEDEAPHSEHFALSGTDFSLSGNSSGPDAAEIGFPRDEEDSDVWSSSNEDIYSLRESEFSAVRARTEEERDRGTLLNSGAMMTTRDNNNLRLRELRRKMEKLEMNKTTAGQEVTYREESLTACRENLEALYQHCSELQNRVDELEGGGGGGGGRKVATCGFLKTQLKRVREEIEREEKVETDLVKELKSAQLQLDTATITHSDQQEIERELREKEKQMKSEKNLKSLQRLQTQTRLRINSQRVNASRKRIAIDEQKEEEEKKREASERARQTIKEGQGFLRASLERRRREEEEEAEKERKEREQRIQAAINLRQNIDNSEGTIQALQLLQEEKRKKRQKCEETLRSEAILRGEDPNEVMMQRKREREEVKKKTEFERKRREKHLEIVTRLLEEEKMKKKKEKMAEKTHWKGRWPPEVVSQTQTKTLRTEPGERKRRIRTEEDVPASNDINDDQFEIETKEAVEQPDEEEEEEEREEDDDEILAEPEVKGQWRSLSESHKGEAGVEGEVVEDGGVRKRGGERSKLEQQTLENVMDNLRQSVVKKQVAAGREFKGCPFTSKPEVAEYLDFTPGECLVQKLQLTNVTYTVNYCKLIGVNPPRLRDFITVDFNPPGAMSAGLTCHMTVTFLPKVNDDIEGEIEMLSQTGPFSIPVRCVTRKCLVRAVPPGHLGTLDRGGGGGRQDKERGGGEGGGGGGGGVDVDFGKIYIGEIVHQTVTLINDGALGTDFTIISCKSEVSDAKRRGEEDEEMEEGGVEGGESESSLPSVMSEVRGDWGAVARLKSSGNKPVSRSTSDLPQITHKKEDKEMVEVVEEEKEEEKKEKEEKEEKEEVEEEGTMDEKVTSVTEIFSAIKVSKNETGHLKGYSKTRIDLVFSPATPSLSSQIFTISFSQPSVPHITVRGRGEGTELPIAITRDNIDLKICTISRLYQDSIEITNRGNVALRAIFTVPPELAPHLEILPPHGLVQGLSSFQAQLKFLPQSEIFTECGHFFDEDCNLRVPAEIRVVDQVLPLSYTITARVTSSDLVFSCSEIDFGTCTVHESVVATLTVTNTSLLSQEFGFVRLPEYINVQPNDGFSTVLPGETVSLDVIFSARKPRDYSFHLTCLSLLNRTFKISCKGRGVLPALKLSDNVVDFVATPLYSASTTRVSITNPQLDRLSSPVIRGAVLPQGTKVFKFSVPDGFPMEISPRVGTIELGQTVSVELCYSPSLSHSAIMEEAIRLATEEVNREIEKSTPLPSSTDDEPATKKKRTSRGSSKAEKKKKKKKANTTSTPSSSSPASSGRESRVGAEKTGREGGGESPVTQGVDSEGRKEAAGGDGEERVKIPEPEIGSEMWKRAENNLSSQFQNWTHQFSIPCFVSSTSPSSSLLSTPPFRLEDTLYLEISVPVIRPSLQLLTNIIDFGSVATGDSLTKQLTIKNISDQNLQLSMTPLDSHGPFDLRNALRPLPPSSSHSLSFKFSPQQGNKFYEVMRLSYSDSGGMELRLVGEGVEPQVELEPDTNRMEFGHTLAKDTSQKLLQLKNTGSLTVCYHVKFDGAKSKFSAKNFSGKSAFDCIPFQGSIEPGSVRELTVSFSSDHSSNLLYFDTLVICINNSPTYTIEVTGQSHSSTMYLLNNNNNNNNNNRDNIENETMMVGVPQLGTNGEHVEPPESVLVLFDASEEGGGGGGGGGEGGGGGGVKRELMIGCIKTPSVKKNSGDFVIEPIPSSNPHSKSFTFDSMKSSVEAGNSKLVTIFYRPSLTGAGGTVDCGVIAVDTNITLKRDTTKTCRLLLRAITID